MQAALEKYQGINVMEKFAEQLEGWGFSKEEKELINKIIPEILDKIDQMGH